MTEPSFLDPSHDSHFSNFPEFNTSDLSFSGPTLFSDSDDFALPEGLASDLDLEDIDVDLDFTVEDLLNDDDSPNSNSNSNSIAAVNSNPGSPLSGNSVVNETVKQGEENNSWRRKRTKEDDEEEDDKNPHPSCRNFKIRRSGEANSSSCTFSAGNDEDERRKARLIRNRESAQLSRQRKKHYVEELEEKVKIMNSTIADLNGKISFYMAENARLHQQLNGNNDNGGGKGGNANANANAPPVVYAPPYPLPWIPYAGYSMRPNGHPVPYVAIPRLKPQQPAPAPKAKKTEGRRSESKSKMKKVASVSLLGVFFIMMVFGGAMNFGFGRSGDKVCGGLSGGSGRVLSVKGRGNDLNSTEEFRVCNGKMGYRYEKIENSSESLPALLYVPRNGKHVEINGNLIIHSVLASERAMAQANSKGKGKESTGKEGTGLVVPGSLASALAVRNGGREMRRHTMDYRNSAEHPRALPSDSHDKYRDNVKSSLADGPLQQWFREGLAGPILNSGTCTEVFQFEVSPSSAIVPATSVVNSTKKLPLGKTKNRRIMYPLQIPLNCSTDNNTHVGKPSDSSNTFHSNNSTSMVVSILADPKEAGDGDGDGMISPKSLSRIFVVVLMDSVKYVTYSCVLPLKSHGPHLVN